nr:MAG TPA: hypothetical protein [Caudoviricetes sp.]
MDYCKVPPFLIDFVLSYFGFCCHFQVLYILQ